MRVIDQHRGILYKICRMYGSTAPDRQDLFQDIIIQLWRSYPSFRGEAKFSTWLYRIALNTAISDLRRQNRRITPVALDPLPIQLNDYQYSTENDERLALLYAAIGRLTEVERALTMLYLEDVRYSITQKGWLSFTQR